jgi:hypothetical protein
MMKLLRSPQHGWRKLTAAQYACIPMRMALDLPSGPASLRIAVHDLDAERAGSLEVPVADADK